VVVRTVDRELQREPCRGGPVCWTWGALLAHLGTAARGRRRSLAVGKLRHEGGATAGAVVEFEDVRARRGVDLLQLDARLARFGIARVPHEARDGNGRQDANDGDDDHELDERETALHEPSTL